MPWTVTRMGTRMELQFMPLTPRHANDIRQGSKPQLESLLHLFMLNRRI
jgi:glutamate-1-semialdehyde 2,1-aminomutase